MPPPPPPPPVEEHVDLKSSRGRDTNVTGYNNRDNGGENDDNCDDAADARLSPIDQLLSLLGSFSKYQKFQFFLHILTSITAGIHMLSLVTIAATPEHRCKTSETDLLYANESIIESRIPYLMMGGSSGEGDFLKRDSCHFMSTLNETMKCTEWLYDSTHYRSSLVIEWNAVCERRWIASLAQSAYMFGVFFGAFLLGGLADRFGRRPVVVISVYGQLAFSLAVAFVRNYYISFALRFFYGMFGSAGAYIPSFVLSMELIGASRRTLCGILFQAAFAFGIILVAFWGYLIPHNIVLLQTIYGLHSLLLLTSVFFLDESPRWLWSKRRYQEAIDIIQKALKTNGNQLIIAPEMYCPKVIEIKAEAEKSYGIRKLFSTRHLALKTINISFCWFANSLTYYGLSLNTGQFQKAFNPFAILFLMGLVELPSYLIVALLLDRLGRKPLIFAFMVVAGLCCVLSGILEAKTAAAAAMMGKFLIAGSFAIVYNYSAELFPTVVRNSAMGLGSMSARLAGILTPLISLLDVVHHLVPFLLFGLASVFSGLCTLWLMETKSQPLPETIEDDIRRTKKSQNTKKNNQQSKY